MFASMNLRLALMIVYFLVMNCTICNSNITRGYLTRSVQPSNTNNDQRFLYMAQHIPCRWIQNKLTVRHTLNEWQGFRSVHNIVVSGNGITPFL